MDDLLRAFGRLLERCRSMSPAARWTVGLCGVVAAVVVGVYWTHDAEADTELMPKVSISFGQLSTMMSAFAKAGLTGHEVRGTSIWVPHGQKDAYLAALADAKALPQDFGQKEAVLDTSPFTPPEQRKEIIKRANQAELACIIRSMQGIENASVLYAEDIKPGIDRQKVVTATVSVKPVGSSQLDEMRVSAIRHLVSGAIACLTPENVTVCDLNGRTWFGTLPADARADDDHYACLKRTYEQDLKTKILDALSYIPGVTVEPSVVLGRPAGAAPQPGPGNATNDPGERPAAGLAPTSARVSVGVPEGYFRKIWQRQRTSAGGPQADNPDPAALERVRAQETAKIARQVAEMLPASDAAANPSNSVTVTTFQEIDRPGHDTASAGWNRETLKALAPACAAIAAIGLVLLCWKAWRPTADRQTAAAKGRATASAAAEAGRSPVGPPHWRRDAGSDRRSPGEELSALVADDPDAAANILRNWIGQVG
jgi:flagellar biosynthesis/type III secretory pathway M-ring protein FliF/YscJ